MAIPLDSLDLENGMPACAMDLRRTSRPALPERGLPPALLLRTIETPLSGEPTADKRRWWPSLLMFGVVGIGVYYSLPWLHSRTSRGREEIATLPQQAVSVGTAAARRTDMDLYLDGLGTVTAFATVTVRSRVEGELIRAPFTEGQMVRKGDLLAEIDPRPFEVQLAQAQGQLAKDQAAFRVAELNLARYDKLLATGSITPQQIDEQIALVDQSKGLIQIDQAQIDAAQLQLTYSQIVAPVSGRIGLRWVGPGNIVRANDPTGIAVITQLQPIAMVFTISQNKISHVQQRFKQDQTLTVAAYDREGRTKLATGKLLAIDNQVDSTTGTVRLKATFENPNNALFPNQFVHARLLVDVNRDAIVVPAAAIQRGPSSTFVYVVKPDETVEFRKVVTGPVEAGQISIESGLSPAEVVVIDGVDKLRPGAKVEVRTRTSAGSEASDTNESSKRLVGSNKVKLRQ